MKWRIHKAPTEGWFVSFGDKRRYWGRTWRDCAAALEWVTSNKVFYGTTPWQVVDLCEDL